MISHFHRNSTLLLLNYLLSCTGRRKKLLAILFTQFYDITKKLFSKNYHSIVVGKKHNLKLVAAFNKSFNTKIINTALVRYSNGLKHTELDISILNHFGALKLSRQADHLYLDIFAFLNNHPSLSEIILSLKLGF
jgi:hypothetical protein